MAAHAGTALYKDTSSPSPPVQSGPHGRPVRRGRTESVKIAILTLDFPPDVGGVQTYLYEVGRRLGEKQHVYVITPVAGDLPPDILISKVQPPRVNALGFWQSLRSLQPDYVLVGHAHPQLLLPAMFATRGRYGVIAHGNDFLAAQPHWHHQVFNWLLRHARPLIANSRANADRLQQLGMPQPIVIQPGTDRDRFTPASVEPSFPPVLLTVGRLVPRKGIDAVLGGLPALRRAYPELQYHIAGDGPDRSRLEALAYKLGVRSAVAFLGRVSDAELPNVYRRAHIFVMPTREEPETASIEGFGIVYLEASASGLPVVAGRSGGAAEAVKHGETGYLVDPHDPDELAEVLLTLLGNRQLRVKLGRAGRRWVKTEMNWDRAARQVEEALQLN